MPALGLGQMMPCSYSRGKTEHYPKKASVPRMGLVIRGAWVAKAVAGHVLCTGLFPASPVTPGHTQLWLGTAFPSSSSPFQPQTVLGLGRAGEESKRLRVG